MCMIIYRFQPNSCAVRLGFSKALGKLAVNILLIRAHFKERSTEDFIRSVFNDADAILFSVFFIEAYVVGTGLNYLNLSRQFKRVPTTYVFIKK